MDPYLYTRIRIPGYNDLTLLSLSFLSSSSYLVFISRISCSEKHTVHHRKLPGFSKFPSLNKENCQFRQHLSKMETFHFSLSLGATFYSCTVIPHKVMELAILPCLLTLTCSTSASSSVCVSPRLPVLMTYLVRILLCLLEYLLDCPS